MVVFPELAFLTLSCNLAGIDALELPIVLTGGNALEDGQAVRRFAGLAN